MNHGIGGEDGRNKQILELPVHNVDGTSCLDYGSSLRGKSEG